MSDKTQDEWARGAGGRTDDSSIRRQVTRTVDDVYHDVRHEPRPRSEPEGEG